MTYDLFLWSAAHYPKFCGYNALNNGTDTAEMADDLCRKELATLLAHITADSSGEDAILSRDYFEGLSTLADYFCEDLYYDSDQTSQYDCRSY